MDVEGKRKTIYSFDSITKASLSLESYREAFVVLLYGKKVIFPYKISSQIFTAVALIKSAKII